MSDVGREELEFSDRIRRARLERGLSQWQVSNATGISLRTLGRCESRRKTRVDLFTGLRLAAFLKIDISDLYRIEAMW